MVAVRIKLGQPLAVQRAAAQALRGAGFSPEFRWRAGHPRRIWVKS